MAVTITKEYLDALPEETILMIRDYIWNRFGKNPVSAVYFLLQPETRTF